MVDIVQRAVCFNRRNRSEERILSIVKKNFEEKVEEALRKLLPKKRINANQEISLCRKN